MTDNAEQDLKNVVSDKTQRRLEHLLDTDPFMSPLLIPPIPLRDVPDYADDGDESDKSRLYGLSDIARAANKANDPVMPATEEWDEDNEEYTELDTPAYTFGEDSTAELKLAVSILRTVYEREQRQLAEDKGVIDNPDHLVERSGETQYDYREALIEYYGWETSKYQVTLRRLASTINEDPEDVFEVLDDEFDASNRLLSYSERDDETVSFEELTDSLNDENEDEE